MTQPPAGDGADGTPLLEVTDLAVRFGPVRAVDGVSLRLAAGPFGLGLVGESGSGKSTIGRAVLRLVAVAGGHIRFEGKDVAALRGPALKQYRRAAQIVFQDPDNSLDPRMRVGASVAEPLNAHRIVGRRSAAGRARDLLAEVGLDPEFAGRYPHQLSGGQRQRVAIARALSVEHQQPWLDTERPAARGPQPRLPAHHPQPRHRQRTVRADGRAVSRASRRERRDQRAPQRPGAPLHPGPALRGAGDRRRRPVGARRAAR